MIEIDFFQMKEHEGNYGTKLKYSAKSEENVFTNH